MTENYIDEFEIYLKNKKKLSINTINSYLIDINKINTYLEDVKIIEFTTSEKEVHKYIITLQKDGYSVNTLNRMVSTINKFNDYLYSKNYISSRIKIENCNNLELKEKNFIVFTKEEINKILDFNLDSFNNIRDKAIFELAYSIGIKPSESINIMQKDVDLDIGYIKYKNSKNNYKIVALNNESVIYLKKYLEILKKENFNEYLFVSNSGKKITRQGYWKIFKRRQKDINLKKELNPTTFRNSLAIHLLEDGVSLENIKELLGLKVVTSLNNYLLQVNIKKSLREIVYNHPRKNLEK